MPPPWMECVAEAMIPPSLPLHQMIPLPTAAATPPDASISRHRVFLFGRCLSLSLSSFPSLPSQSNTPPSLPRPISQSMVSLRLPVARPGKVLGLVGTNGFGILIALKVLAGKPKPNLGRFNNPHVWKEILTYFRGSELQNYFTRILEDNLKPPYMDHIPTVVQGNVGQVLEQKDERDVKEELCVDLELNQVLDRNVACLSGGELQRFAIAIVAIQNAEIYMFDEPSSYLDVKQSLKASQVVRSLLRPNRRSSGGSEMSSSGFSRRDVVEHRPISFSLRYLNSASSNSGAQM